MGSTWQWLILYYLNGLHCETISRAIVLMSPSLSGVLPKAPSAIRSLRFSAHKSRLTHIKGVAAYLPLSPTSRSCLLEMITAKSLRFSFLESALKQY